MDLVDIVITTLECLFVGLGMELGSVLAKLITVKILNDSSPVTVHDGEDEETEEEVEEEQKKKRRRRSQVRSANGPSTPASFHVRF